MRGQVHADDIGPVVIALMNAQAYQATKFISKKLVIRATKPRLKGRKKQWSQRDTRECLNVTIGAPNHRERVFAGKFTEGTLPTEIQLRPFPGGTYG